MNAKTTEQPPSGSPPGYAASIDGKHNEKGATATEAMGRAMASFLRGDQETIHNEGSVELIQTWKPGGAQGNTDQLFVDGDQYLFAVRLSDDRWEFVAVYAHCDAETPVDFRDENGNPWDSWSWSDVEWFVACADLDLPVPVGAA